MRDIKWHSPHQFLVSSPAGRLKIILELEVIHSATVRHVFPSYTDFAPCIELENIFKESEQNQNHLRSTNTKKWGIQIIFCASQVTIEHMS